MSKTVQDAMAKVLAMREQSKIATAIKKETVAPALNEATIVSDTQGAIIPQKAGFEANNWLLNPNNATLSEINNRGGAIWLNAKGDLSYRFSTDGDIYEAPDTKTSKVFTAYLRRSVALLTREEGSVKAHELKLIQSSEFLPHCNREFTDDGKRNTFKPSKYMMLEQRDFNEPTVIISLISHLVKNDADRARWVTNWLAGFFQKLRKSQVSLVLRGIQGAGKGVLFDKVIRPLFGDNQTIQINDKTLNTNFLGGVVEGKLFTNLDEVSHNIASSKAVKNFIKALVTNDRITAEKKHQNIERETRLWGQVFITSNEPYIIEVEARDRRFTVYETGKTLKAVDFLGCKSADKLFHKIEDELEAFALYLKSYEVDWKLFDDAQDTKEKQALVEATNDKFTLFANAIKNKDIPFFDDIGEFSIGFLETDFDGNRVCKEDLPRLFEGCFEEKISGKALMKRLRAIDPYLFSDDNTSKSGSKRYFLLANKEE